MDDSAQNRAGTGQDPSTGRFTAGNRANPGGRPKGLAALIRSKSKDGAGEELVDFLFTVVRDPEATLKDRRAAAEWLGDHLWGKAPQTVKVEEGASLEDLPDTEFEAMVTEYLARRRTGQGQPAAKTEGM